MKHLFEDVKLGEPFEITYNDDLYAEYKWLLIHNMNCAPEDKYSQETINIMKYHHLDLEDHHVELIQKLANIERIYVDEDIED